LNPEQKSVVILSLGLLLTVLVYTPGMSGTFILDDMPQIVSNPYLQMESLSLQQLKLAMLTSDAGPLGRPVAMLSFALNDYLFGMTPFSFKLVNLFIHLTNSALLFLLLRSLLGALAVRNALPGLRVNTTSLAAFVSVIWLIHPVNLTAVLYVVQRMTSLSATFMLLSMWLYIIWREKLGRRDNTHWIFLLGSATSALLGLYTKETAALLSIYMLLIEAFLFGFRCDYKHWRLVIRTGYAGIILALLTGLMWLLFVSPAWLYDLYLTRTYTLGERLFTEARVLFYYLRLVLLLPINEYGLFHDDIDLSSGLFFPWTTALSCLGLLGLITTAVIFRKRVPLVAFGIAWFIGGHLLESSFLPLEIAFEHRNYLPAIGPLLLLAYGLFTLPQTFLQPHSGAVMLSLFIVIAASITALRAYDWSSEYNHAVAEYRNHPESFRANLTLAGIQLEWSRQLSSGDRNKMHQLAQERLRRAADLDKSKPIALFVLLMSAYCFDKPVDPAWMHELELRIRNTPMSSSTIRWLDMLTLPDSQVRCGMPSGDMERLLKAGFENSNKASWLTAKFNVVASRFFANEYNNAEMAIYLLALAIEQEPTDPSYRVFMGKLMNLVGRNDEAKEELELAKSLDPLGIYTSLIANIAADIEKNETASDEN